MGKKRRPRGEGRAPAYTIFARISPAIGAAFDQFLDSQELRTSVTAAIELFVAEGLQARGFWPPKDAKTESK